MTKFNLERVMETAERFVFAHDPEIDGERRAADLFADELAQAGWQVESTKLPRFNVSTEILVANYAVLLGVTSLLVIAALGRGLTIRGLSQAQTLVFLIGCVVTQIMGGALARRRNWSAPSPSRNVIGSVASESDSDVRVVLCTFLARPSRHRGSGNGTGLALLLEFARTLPKSIQDRVEIRLAGIGGRLDIGIHAIVYLIRSRWRDKPTLLIEVVAPGHGSEIVVEGNGTGLELARQTATDLWIPMVSHRRRQRLNLRYGDAAVALQGNLRASSVDAALLPAVAQLIHELALRWAKSHYDEYRLARSSQNPG